MHLRVTSDIRIPSQPARGQLLLIAIAADRQLQVMSTGRDQQQSFHCASCSISNPLFVSRVTHVF